MEQEEVLTNNPIKTVHSFYKGEISEPLKGKLKITAQNGKTMWTNTFKIAKEFATGNQLTNQLTLF